eukprot:scaffold1848_cov106-Isochrysis_galbana.AAC.2
MSIRRHLAAVLSLAFCPQTEDLSSTMLSGYPLEPEPTPVARWCSPEMRSATTPRDMGHMLWGLSPKASAKASTKRIVFTAPKRRSPLAADLDRIA